MTSVSLSRAHLKRRIDDYLWRDSSRPLSRLRELLRHKFMSLGQTAVIGGLLRDVARRGSSGFKSDIDLVIKADPFLVENLAIELSAVPNRFGGFGLVTPSWKIDFWALRNTWAHKAGLVKVRTLSDLTRCTFFTTDAVIYNTHTREVYASETYLHSILHRQIEINLLENPSPNGNLVRAVRRILSWNLSPGPRLREFLISHLDDESFRYVLDTESELYGNSFASHYKDAEELLEALLYRADRHMGKHGTPSQYSLPM